MLAPSRARRLAMAAPIPRLPPVTRTRLPSSDRLIEDIASSLLAPAPARRLTLHVTDGHQPEAQDGGVGYEAQGLLRRQEEDRAQRKQSEEEGEHEPALPGAWRSPSPTVALRREPVLGRRHAHFAGGAFTVTAYVATCD